MCGTVTCIFSKYFYFHQAQLDWGEGVKMLPSTWHCSLFSACMSSQIYSPWWDVARRKKQSFLYFFLFGTSRKNIHEKKSEDHNSGLWSTPYQVSAYSFELKAILALGSREIPWLHGRTWIRVPSHNGRLSAISFWPTSGAGEASIY